MSLRFFWCLIALLLLLSGCGKARTDNYLSYQNYPLEAQGTLSLDDHSYEVRLSVTQAGELRLEFLSPSSIAGLVMEKRGGECFLSYGSIEESVTADGYLGTHGVLLAASMFSLTAESYDGAGVTTEAGIRYSYADYRVEEGSVRVLFAASETMPCRIDATLNGRRFSFEFVNET